ncbi:MAG: VOC family protein [Rhodospirillaceae bacterium]|jgi:catechol 2,3-dioxygenase-like lactoylglutathione lyase family enzyme|nr:VOC family protein [Rhodospirillaceae bacterium]MBT5240278.1 VOC family protein [Rhodospirillaceae bacterium]MBT5565417.1 VOC family protein [Rhodospirillaceae bacterium]MBT6089267.1 VOC family protein [Rhodospirillaceae bacterium]MBT6959746.1 VOC family protein [Rhodospirillaceae bacterium]
MANSPTFKRINLCVADLERSLTIYRDILGFTVDYQKDSKEDSYSYPVFTFPKEAKLRFATLNTASQERTLALTEVTGIDLPPMPVPRMVAAVINCPAFDEVIEKIAAAGLEVVPPQHLPDQEGNSKGRETAFIDPDGHLIVLYILNDQ